MVIKNALVLNPGSESMDLADIRIQNGIITDIVRELDKDTGEEELDAGGMIVAPGLMDGHVHFRDPGFTYKEDIHTGAQAAAAGGFTSVVCMANTKPLMDNVESYSALRKRELDEKIHIYQAAAVSMDFKGKELTDFVRLQQEGAVCFTDDGIPLKDEKFVRKAMERAKSIDALLSFHEEDPTLITVNGINDGEAGRYYHTKGSPALAEEIMVVRDCRLAMETMARIVIQHVSSARSVEIIRKAQKAGAMVYAEATPHHFSLTEQAVIKWGSMAKMNPPLRTEADRQGIIQGLRDNTITLIATDHAPHSAEEKAGDITKTPSGIIGLETSLSLGITNLVKPGYLTLSQLIEKMTINPARLYKIPGGEIKRGAPGDLVIFDPKKQWTPRNFLSKSDNSPFKGMSLTGKVYATICNGNIVYNRIGIKDSAL